MLKSVETNGKHFKKYRACYHLHQFPISRSHAQHGNAYNEALPRYDYIEAEPQVMHSLLEARNEK